MVLFCETAHNDKLGLHTLHEKHYRFLLKKYRTVEPSSSRVRREVHCNAETLVEAYECFMKVKKQKLGR